jgi:hypothetical protein
MFAVTDDRTLGDVWTFCAIDSETKLVPAFKIGKRNHVTANAFVSDIASRIKNRPQILPMVYALTSKRLRTLSAVKLTTE